MVSTDARFGLIAGTSSIAVIGAVLLGNLRVGMLWVILWVILAVATGFAIAAFVNAKGARARRWCIAGAVLSLVAGTCFVAAKGQNDAFPARVAAAAAYAAEKEATAKVDALYHTVLADLRQQGLSSEIFRESVDGEKLAIVDGNHVRIRLDHQTTGTTTFDVRKINGRWILVCPTLDGGWLTTYDRDNWLAGKLNIGGCPPGIQ